MSPRARPARRNPPGCALAAGALAVLALAGCSKAAPDTVAVRQPAAPATTGAGPAVAATPSAPATLAAPLTGVSVATAVAQRSAVAVAVSGSHPTGLSGADIVVEELSDVTRWVALFQSSDDQVGPVSSTRPMDAVLLSVLHPAYVFNGGSRGPVKHTLAAPLSSVNAIVDRTGFAGSGSSLTVSTSAIRARTKAPPAFPLLDYVGPTAEPPPGMRPATRIEIRTGGTDQVWTYAAGHWRANPGPDIAPANLIFQFVEYKSVQLTHPDAGTVPSARLIGTGRAVVATDGKMLDGGWRKPGIGKLTTYATAHGALARLAVGQTLIVLVPSSTTISVR